MTQHNPASLTRGNEAAAFAEDLVLSVYETGLDKTEVDVPWFLLALAGAPGVPAADTAAAREAVVRIVGNERHPIAGPVDTGDTYDRALAVANQAVEALEPTDPAQLESEGHHGLWLLGALVDPQECGPGEASAVRRAVRSVVLEGMAD